MKKSKIFIVMCALLTVFLSLGVNATGAQQTDTVNTTVMDKAIKAHQKVTPAERKAAAENAAALGLQLGVEALGTALVAPATLDPGGIPHYFGPYPNWAYSPMPTGTVNSIALTAGGSGYTAPAVSIVDLYDTPGASGAAASATIDAGTGAITEIALTSGGAGYTEPIVVITDATGSGATAMATIGGPFTGGIRKFVDSAPGLGAAGANNLGQYLPIAAKDTTTYPGSDYYEIALVEFAEQMHSDLPPTTNRGYVQLGTTAVPGTVPLTNPDGSPIMMPDGVTQAMGVDAPHFLGPVIVADYMVPVRVKFYNLLPTGAGGDLFLPVDTTAMGAGTGPLGGDEMYTENRAAVHLHGGDSVWISDGTPNQWITPAGETTSYPVGVSAINVPDMADPGDGAMTFYYTNAQGARLMFYHDHALAITRLNVYAGEAAAYLITDQVEKDLINGTNVSGVNPTNGAFLPDIGIPLVIQDRGFVDANTIAAQDPTWNAGTTPPVPNTGDLWYPHVYMPAQNPWDPTGANQFGRWHYAAWFWPPATDLMYPPIPNPYYDPIGAPWEPPEMPATPNPSMVGEAFMDTPVINGAAYPYLEVQPQAYRFRILNAANDRFWNLQLYETGLTVHLVNGGSGYSATPSVAFSGGGATADATATAVVTDGVITDITITDPGAGYTSAPTVTITDATGAGAIAVAALNTEVKMVAAPDGREGGVPDPMTAGPDWIQIGTEGGFLPAPAVVPTQPVTWNLDPTTFNFGNVENHSLLLGPAERADVIVDFSAFAGKTLLVYNDAPAAFPALDSRYDYYTGNPDQTDTGGAPTTQPGYGPNIRTIMQIRVADTAPAAAYDLAALQTVWAKTDVKPGVFESCQNQIIMPQADYNSAYNATFPGDPAGAYVLQFEFSKTFTPIGAAAPVTIPLEPKAIQDEMGEAYDIEYGRMSGLLGLELPVSQAGAQNFMLYPFMSPPVEIIRGSVFGTPIGSMSDGTQIWKITHNGVDTHTIHVHLFNAQLVNRVAWDGALIPPDPNELGWKETFRVNPLEHTILALRPILPNVPFQVPNSVRPIDPTRPVGAMLMAPLGGFKDPLGNGVMIMNHLVNFGAEYMEHCHLLAHEEMDMMHAIVIADTPVAPSSLDAELKGNTGTLTWTDNALNETGFLVQRAVAATGPWTDIGSAPAAAETGSTVTFQDPDTLDKKTTYYYQVMASNVVGDVDTPGFPTMTANSEAATAMLGSGNAAPPAIDSFTATPATINAGESATLTWQTTGATSVAINQGMGSQPVNGSMAVSPSATMTYTLTATGPSGTTTATATVTVTPPVGNIPPVAVNDTAATIKNTAVTFSVITNDYDPDGTIDPATVSVSATQKGGTVVSNGDGTVTFTPKDNVGGGSDTFTYTVQDNGTPPAVSNTATVTVNISNK